MNYLPLWPTVELVRHSFFRRVVAVLGFDASRNHGQLLFNFLLPGWDHAFQESVLVLGEELVRAWDELLERWQDRKRRLGTQLLDRREGRAWLLLNKRAKRLTRVDERLLLLVSEHCSGQINWSDWLPLFYA